MANVKEFGLNGKVYTIKDEVARSNIERLSDTLDANVENLNRNIDSVNDKIDGLEDSLDDTNNDVASINSSIDRTNNNLGELNRKQDNLEVQVNSSLSEIEDNAVRLAVLEGRMNEFSRLPDGSTSGDSELADIRVDFEGVTHETAGDSVRAQAELINEGNWFDLNLTGAVLGSGYSYVRGSLSAETGNNTTDNTRIRSEHITLNARSRLKLIPSSAIKYRVYHYTSERVFKYAEDWMEVPKIVYGSDAEDTIRLLIGYRDNREILDINGAKAELTNQRLYSGGYAFGGKVVGGALTECSDAGVYIASESAVALITDLPDDFGTQAFNLFVIRPSYGQSNQITLQILFARDGRIWNRIINLSNNEFVVYQDWSRINYHDNGIPSTNSLMNCRQFGYYRGGASDAENLTDLPDGFGNTAFIMEVITPAYASKYFVEQRIQAVSGEQWRRVLNYTDGQWIVFSNWKRTNGDSGSMLTGKKLSVMGDSISAFAGEIPAGYEAFYNGSNAGVRNASYMWYNVLCRKLGMTKCVINGYSGSGVTQLEDADHSTKIPMSSDQRCANLGSGDNMPDVILIAGGVNDYTYAQSAQSEPLSWNTDNVPVLENNFTQAYACMIRKIQDNYPNAIVVAMSTFFTMRGANNGYTRTHTVGGNKWTQQDYNDKIKFVAEQMNIPYLDVSDIGFNANNYYPTYAQDSSTNPTHPNEAGHAVIGNAVAEKLLPLVKGFLS